MDVRRAGTVFIGGAWENVSGLHKGLRQTE